MDKALDAAAAPRAEEPPPYERLRWHYGVPDELIAAFAASVRASAAAAPPGEPLPKHIPDLIDRDRLWCAALIPEGPDVIERVTRRFLEYRSAAPSAAAAPPERQEGET